MGHRAGQNLITEQQLGHSAGKVKTRFLLFASKTTCHLNRSLLWFKHVAEFFPPPGWWSVWALIFQLTAWVQQEGFQKKRSSLAALEQLLVLGVHYSIISSGYCPVELLQNSSSVSESSEFTYSCITAVQSMPLT